MGCKSPFSNRLKKMNKISDHEKKFEEYIARLVSLTLRDGGSASRPDTRLFLPPRDLWSFPKYPSKTVILPPTVDLALELQRFITVNEVSLNEEDCWLGTWINPRSGEYYFDVATGCKKLSEAQEMAREAGVREGRRVVALFNSKRNETVYL